LLDIEKEIRGIFCTIIVGKPDYKISGEKTLNLKQKT